MPRSLPLFFAAGAVLGAVVACSSSPSTCLPSNCPGCCATDGTCQDGTAAQACGQSAQACLSCLPGYDCSGGQCQFVGTDGGQTTDAGGKTDGGATGTDAGSTDGGPQVGYCKLGGDPVTAPPTVDLSVGAAGPLTYGQVYAKGVTDMTGQGPGIVGQLGYGAVGSDPSAGGWTWVDAQYNADTHNGSNDQYAATLPNPGLGSYAFAYRFTLNGGAPTYCDAAGSNTGYSPSQAGTLNVTGVGVNWCNLQYPPTVLAQAGTASPLVYGRVYGQHITDGTGQGPGITAQVGYGPQDAGPSTGAWTWTNAAYNTKYGSNDEYQGTFTIPAQGSYSYLYRFAYDGGAPVYCDLDGGPPGSPLNNPGALTSVTTSHIKYVFVIAEENQNANTIYSAPTPYIAKLMDGGGYALNYQDLLTNPDLPSEPHYVWMEAGTNAFSDVTFTTDDDPSSSNSTSSTAHLSTEIKTNGGDSWLSYQENLPASCPVTSVTPFASKHDPFIFFQDVSGNPPSTTNSYCGSHHRDYSQLASDLAASPPNVAHYNFITPNLCDDMHGDPSCLGNGCTAAGAACITAGDNWLAANLPPLIAFCQQNQGVIFLIWDEAGSVASSTVNPFIVLGPNVKPGYSNSIAYSHSSLVRSVEEIMAVPQNLGTVSGANDFSDFFTPGTFP
jgi:hypothetical protein